MPPGSDWINDELVGGKPLYYLTKKDRMLVYTDLIRFSSGETGLNNLTITLENRDGNVIPAKFETVVEEDKQVVLIDIHAIPEDLYTVKLSDPKPFEKEFSFYRLSRHYSRPDLIIDLGVKSDNDTYSMTAANGSLISPDTGKLYELRFRNRFTQWRYLGERFSNKPVTGPHPLTKKGFIHVSVADDNGDTMEDLPNPSARMIKAEHPNDDPKHYDVISEIFIH